ncbi:hypothetical protein PRO82_000731, partial [Candidatus Protochlamydia amoebophila]|uniref:tetratricopeptide repeat protein n=1 Tax=Candidatus Protochlamydia amoebophila TaxID=362787 RepID=UPI001BD81384
MNVKSIESSPFYYPTSFSQSPPTPSILDHVKGLIEAYNTNFATEENVIISAKWLLEEINQLKDIGVKRECLCRLLTLEMEEVQHLIVEEVTSLFDLRTFLYDIQHGQAQQLIQLEEITSEIIASKLSLNELNFLFPICMIYQNILEHLWLLPHLESSNYCANLLAQNKTFILSHMEHWKDNFDQLAKEEKIEPLIPKNLEMAVLRLFEPLPEAIVKKIEEEKSVIHKSGEMTSRILEIIILVCSDQGDFPRAIFHAEVFLEFLRQKCSEMSQKGKLIIRIMQIHRNLATWNQILKQYERAIYYGKEALRIARESGNPYEVIINLKGMGSLYIAQGRGKLALPFYTEARSITQILKDAENESKILTDLADAYLSIDKNDEAITCFQAALNLAENKFEQALICIEIANAYAKGQCYQLAKEAYQKALHFCPQDNIFLAIIIHEKFANFFVNFSRYEKAISHAEKILELIQHSSVQKKESKTLDIKLRALTILGNIYGTFGDYARELDYHTQALEINEKPNFFSQSLEITYSNLGNAYGNVKDYSKSIDYYNKALGITKDVSLRTKIFLNMANVWGELGKFDKTIELYEEANKIDNLEIKQHSLLGLGVCYDIMGNKEQAIQCIEKSICLSQASKDRLNEALGYHNLGEVYSKSDLRLAEENYRKSIAISAALHQELKNHQQWQITFFEEQAKTLLSLERLLIKQSKIEEVLRVTDFRRSRALVSALTEKFQFQKVDSLTSSGLTSQDMQALAHKLNTCFILYSFSVENTDSITVWVVPAQGEIICQQLPLGILKEEVEEAP